MIEADSFLKPAVEAGFDFYTGVPCSFLTPIINRVISDTGLDYVGAASEGEAVAIAAGAWLAGRGYRGNVSKLGAWERNQPAHLSQSSFPDTDAADCNLARWTGN